jgi:thiamine pyrophosphokinase
MQKAILIIANGRPPRHSILEPLKTSCNIVIAVDGGGNLCYERQIYPDYIVGDMDSILPKVKRHFKDVEIIQIDDQETNDLEKAIGFCQILRPSVIRIVAAFGKRLDHSLANILVLQANAKQTPLEIYDDYGMLSIIQGELSYDYPVGKTISLFSFLPVYGLSLQGFKYPLQNADFPDGFNGLSNVVCASPIKISIIKGSLFLYTLHADN